MKQFSPKFLAQHTRLLQQALQKNLIPHPYSNSLSFILHHLTTIHQQIECLQKNKFTLQHFNHHLNDAIKHKNKILTTRLGSQQRLFIDPLTKLDKKDMKESITVSRKPDADDSIQAVDQLEIESIYNFMREAYSQPDAESILQILYKTPFFKCLSDRKIIEQIKGTHNFLKSSLNYSLHLHQISLQLIANINRTVQFLYTRNDKQIYQQIEDLVTYVEEELHCMEFKILQVDHYIPEARIVGDQISAGFPLKGLIGYCVFQQKVIHVAEAQLHASYDHDFDSKICKHNTSVLMMPSIHEGRTDFILAAFSKVKFPKFFSEQDYMKLSVISKYSRTWLLSHKDQSEHNKAMLYRSVIEVLNELMVPSSLRDFLYEFQIKMDKYLYIKKSQLIIQIDDTFVKLNSSKQILELPLLSGIAGRVFRNGMPYCLRRASFDPDFNALIDIDTNLPLGNIPIIEQKGQKVKGVIQFVTYRGYQNLNEKVRELKMMKSFKEGMQVLATTIYHVLTNNLSNQITKLV